MNSKKGFTLIELLVVISIIALISSVIAAAVTKAKVRARDSQRIQNARQLSLALEQYEQSKQTYKIAGSGYGGEGYGYVAKGADEAGYSNSIVSALKADGYYSSINLKDPIYGLDNYYLGLCTSTGAYNIFVKLEQEDLTQSSTTISTGCGGTEAAALGFNYVAAVIGGNVGGGSIVSGGGSLAAVGIVDTTYVSTPNGNIHKIYPAKDNKMMVYGNFSMYDGLSVNDAVVRLNENGSRDTSFVMGNDSYRARFLIPLPDGRTVIGGPIDSYNGVVRKGILIVKENGDLDTSFVPAIQGTNPYTFSAAIYPGNKLIITGQFTQYASTTKNHMALINLDGTLDTSFDSGTGGGGGAPNYINTVAVQSDGKILIGGSFTKYNGSTTARIARLNADGSLDTTFNVGSGFDWDTFKIFQKPNGQILVAGRFDSYNGARTDGLALLNSNGTRDTSFNTGPGGLLSVEDFVVQPDGKIIVAGPFTTIGTSSRKYLARLNPNGSIDESFFLGNDYNNNITAAALQPDGKVVLGGMVTNIAGTPVTYIARIK